MKPKPIKGVYLVRIGNEKVKVGWSGDVLKRIKEHKSNAVNYADFYGGGALYYRPNAFSRTPREIERELLVLYSEQARYRTAAEYFAMPWWQARQIFLKRYPSAIELE